MNFRNPFKKMKAANEAPEADTTSNQPGEQISIEEDMSTDADFSKDVDEAESLKHKRIMMAAGCIGLFIAGLMASNMLFKSPPAKDPSLPQDIKSATSHNENDPAKALPADYASIAKYRQATEAKAKAEQAQKAQVQQSQSAPVVHQSDTSVRVNNASQASNNQRDAERQHKAELQKAYSSTMGITFSNSGNATSGSIATNVNATSGQESQAGGSYALQAGSVIQATLLTGITSDMPGDVVAQVRQNIYDSLTGTHLLIPQGSRLIGKSGGAGSRGNARIAVTFTRVILPNGQSINLPNQYAIDGVGYPGMKDQYTEHTGKMYSTAFMTALIAAAAQSATGGTSGTDTRSSGQEAVSGAVADVLDTLEDVIDRQGQVQPTATIRPGFEFSVFINQDLMLSEYMG